MTTGVRRRRVGLPPQCDFGSAIKITPWISPSLSTFSISAENRLYEIQNHQLARTRNLELITVVELSYKSEPFFPHEQPVDSLCASSFGNRIFNQVATFVALPLVGLQTKTDENLAVFANGLLGQWLHHASKFSPILMDFLETGPRAAGKTRIAVRRSTALHRNERPIVLVPLLRKRS